MIRKFMFAAVMAGLLAACGDGASYPIAAAEVTSKLMATRPPMFVFGNSGANVMVTQGDGGAVHWTILQGGKQVMRLTASVTPDGDSASRVAVSVDPPSNDSATASSMAENPQIVKLYKAAMAEQIDAKLNNREFNTAAIQGQMVVAAEIDRRARQHDADAAYERDHEAAMSGYGSENNSGN
jgi:hypothetical protein